MLPYVALMFPYVSLFFMCLPTENLLSPDDYNNPMVGLLSTYYVLLLYYYVLCDLRIIILCVLC